MKKINLFRLILAIVCLLAILSVIITVVVLNAPGGGKNQDVTYTVNFYINEGDATPYETTKVTKGQTVSQPDTNPTKEGYAFNGWNFDFTAIISGNTNIYAQWTQNPPPEPKVTYTVSFYLDEDDEIAYAIIAVDKGAKVALPVNPNKAGYTFDGWSGYDLNTPITQSVIVTAQWTLSPEPVTTYNVSFDLDSGIASPAILLSQTINEGECAIDPFSLYSNLTITKDGYTFKGWDFDFATLINEDTVITAKWEEVNPAVTYTVSFDLNGGVADSMETIPQQIVDAGGYAMDPLAWYQILTISKTGCTFAGWYLNDEQFDFLNIPITGNITLTAGWVTTFEFVQQVDSYYLSKYNGNKATVTVPGVYEGLPVTAIGNNAFENCQSVVAVILPDSITTIGNYVFAGCSNLTNIDLSGVTTIGSFAFADCVSLKDIDLSGVGRIDTYAFRNCQSLKLVNLSNLGFLGSCALSDSGIETIIMEKDGFVFSGWQYDQASPLIAPNDPDYINKVINSGVVLRSIWEESSDFIFMFVPQVNSYCLAKYNGNSAVITVPATYKDLPVYAIINYGGSGAFANCQSVETVFLPSSVTYVGNNAFAGCTNLTYINLENVLYIDSNAFDGCLNLQSVNLSSISFLYSNALTNSGIEEILMERDGWNFLGWQIAPNSAIISDIEVVKNSNVNLWPNWEEVVPENIYTVSFYLNESDENPYATITVNDGQTVTPPNDPTKEGYFFVCWDFDFLQQITSNINVNALWLNREEYLTLLPSMFNLNYIAEKGYYEIGLNFNASSNYSQYLINLFIPASYNGIPIGRIAYSGFMGCNMKKVIFEDPLAMKELSNAAFYRCSNLSYIDLSGVETIGLQAFYYCYGLKNVDLSNVTIIGAAAFKGCANLEGVDLSGVEFIDSQAFQDCTSLIIINLFSIVSLDSYAFSGCTSLQEIIMERDGYRFVNWNMYNGTSDNNYQFIQNLIYPSSYFTITPNWEEA